MLYSSYPTRALRALAAGGVFVSASAAFAQSLQPPAGDPLTGLTAQQLDRWQKGRVAFDTPIEVFEGLGPVFNQNRCGACHNDPLGGSGSIFVTRFGAEEEGVFDPLSQFGGSLLQAEAIDPNCKEVIPPEANVIAQRITTSALGLGLIEAIPDADIQYYEANPPPGVSGRVHWVQPLEDPNGPLRVGRMGWKAQVATVLSFSGDASGNEMGLTNALLKTEQAPNGDPLKLAMCDAVPDPEDKPDGEGVTFIERVTDFQRFLAAPPQTPRSGMTGEAIFDSVGCTKCHVQSFTTSNDPNLPEPLRNKVIRPYSDFLLHDMGLLGDGIEQGMATGFEFRTPPLWGLRLRDPLIHDGRVSGGSLADRVNAAVDWHNVFGSEAKSVAANYVALSATEKDQVIAFLDSLGKREFDDDGDNDIDPLDLHGLKGCYGGGPYTPDDPCAVHDVDQDGDVDGADLAAMLTVYTGWKGDCNKNGTPDPIEIVGGLLPDADFDGYPDTCCPGDLNNDKKVDQGDLGILLAAYGLSAAGDLDGDYDTDQADLGILLALYNTSCP